MNIKILLDEFFAHLEQMNDDDVRASIQRAEHLTAKCANEIGDINEDEVNQMAYSDYGAFVYKNGIRRTDKEDAPVFSSNEETFGTDINAIPSSARIWVSLFEMKKRREKSTWINSIHHGICGDGPIRVVCHKQGLPRIYEAIEDAINEVLFYDPKEIAKYDYDQFNFEYKGYHFHFESNDPYDSNSPYIAEMIEPDGTHWRCEYDYEYGAGFEDE